MDVKRCTCSGFMREPTSSLAWLLQENLAQLANTRAQAAFSKQKEPVLGLSGFGFGFGFGFGAGGAGGAWGAAVPGWAVPSQDD